MNKNYYKSCIVPECKSTRTKTPNKLFIYVPNDEKIRKKWLRLARRDERNLSTDSRMYFCEDHFDLPNDMENYMQYHIMGSVAQIRMKPGCMPSKFQCQEIIRKRLYSSMEHSNILKKQRSQIKTRFLRESDKKRSQSSSLKEHAVIRSKSVKRKKPIKMVPIILVHGGAGDIPQSRVEGKLNGVRVAARIGQKILLQGGSALDAVEAAVVSMEKDEYFNAGFGSVLNVCGEVEMEASLMCGKDLNVGAVTLVKDFLHPISIAHKVLTDSPHSFLGGEGAKIFALEKGFSTVPPESLISEHAKAALNDFLEHGEFGRTEIGKTVSDVGTVGAVALDGNGHIAVATSTGGMSGKALGRIGDTPQIGSGTYADDNIGGVSTTGHGESILKYCLAHSIIKLMENGNDASTATKTAVEGMTKRLNNTAGAITLSKNGDVGIHFSSNRLAWAYIKSNKIIYGINHNEVLEDDYVAV